MIFLPNKFERYTASLRNFIHKSALEKEISTKQITILKKILIAEAYANQNLMPTNISSFSYKILLKSYFIGLEKNKNFKFIINLKGNFLICQKSYCLILLSLCKYSEYIEISDYKNSILIKAKNCIKKPNNLLFKKLKAKSFFEIKSKDLIINIPAEKTEKKEEPFNINLSLNDPFSTINLFLN